MDSEKTFPAPVPHQAFDDFVATIAALRAPDGCPWDREQTHRSIASNMIEEAYEAVEAIEAGDNAHLREELGDVLLQVVLQSQIASDEGLFTIDDVLRDVNKKIIHRHPHVFGDKQASSAQEVLSQWEKIKVADQTQEAQDAPSQPSSLLQSIPRNLPALMEAQKISRKAVAAGFEWETLQDIWTQLSEEIGELNQAYQDCPRNEDGTVKRPKPGDDLDDAERDSDENAVRDVELEFGDVLFTLVNIARRMGVSAESSLRAANQKFRERWSAMEAMAAHDGHQLNECDFTQLNAYWDRSKTQKPKAPTSTE